jgi:hypothetical protein
MAFYDKKWKTGPTGLGAVLSEYGPQDPTRSRIVLYASRSLSVDIRKKKERR